MEFERIACKKFKNFSSFYDYCYIFDISGQILTKSGFYEWRMCDRILYSFPKGMRFSMNKTKLDICDLVRMAAENPARLMGLENKKGAIKPGNDADFILFKDNFDIERVYIQGRQLF